MMLSLLPIGKSYMSKKKSKILLDTGRGGGQPTHCFYLFDSSFPRETVINRVVRFVILADWLVRRFRFVRVVKLVSVIRVFRLLRVVRVVKVVRVFRESGWSEWSSWSGWPGLSGW